MPSASEGEENGCVHGCCERGPRCQVRVGGTVKVDVLLEVASVPADGLATGE